MIAWVLRTAFSYQGEPVYRPGICKKSLFNSDNTAKSTLSIVFYPFFRAIMPAVLVVELKVM